MGKLSDGLVRGSDGIVRCWWPGDDPLYLRYHDREWGRPLKVERRLYEKLCLEGFQAGLSWITVLRKRKAFRSAFEDFDPEEVAFFTPRDVERLMRDANIIRHRGKIESAINNARRTLEFRSEGGLPKFIWAFEPIAGRRPKRMTRDQLIAKATSPESVQMSRDLKARGWSFVGPTTLYAFMQSSGLVNDHLEGCFARVECERERAAFRRPDNRPGT